MAQMHEYAERAQADELRHEQALQTAVEPKVGVVQDHVCEAGARNRADLVEEMAVRAPVWADDVEDVVGEEVAAVLAVQLAVRPGHVEELGDLAVWLWVWFLIRWWEWPGFGKQVM